MVYMSQRQRRLFVYIHGERKTWKSSSGGFGVVFVARAGKLGEYYCFLSAYDHDNPKDVQGHRTKMPYMVIAAWRSSSESLVRIQNASLLCTSFSAETEKGLTPLQIRGSAQSFCRVLPGRLAIILVVAEHLDLWTDCRGAFVPPDAH